LNSVLLIIVYDTGKKQRVIIGISVLQMPGVVFGFRTVASSPWQMRMASGLTFPVSFNFNKAMKLQGEGRNSLHADTCCPIGSFTCWKYSQAMDSEVTGRIP